MSRKKIEFKASLRAIDGTEEEREFAALAPSVQDNNMAQKQYNIAFRDAIESKALLRIKLDDYMRDQGLWDDDKQIEVNRVSAEIATRERVLAKGGIKLKDAKEVALELKSLRGALTGLISDRTSLDNNTAEGQADNARFNYLVSACVVYNDGETKVFSGLDDYLNRATEDVSAKGAKVLANMLYGLADNYEATLPENDFLVKYKFAKFGQNSQMYFIDEDGDLVNYGGEKIDEEGYLIDDDGNRVDGDGNPIDADGNYIQQQPFLDDDGEPVLVDEDEKPEPEKVVEVEAKVEAKVEAEEDESKDEESEAVVEPEPEPEPETEPKEVEAESEPEEIKDASKPKKRGRPKKNPSE